MEAGLQEVVQMAVPELADWCTIDLINSEGEQRQVLSVHPDPRMGELLRELRRRFRAQTGRSEGVAKVMDSQKPVLYHHTETGPLVEMSDDERRLYEELAPQSTMIVPLVVRGTSIGAMTFLSCRPDRRYTDEDVSLMVALATRLALLIDNARLKLEAESTLALLDSLYSNAPIGLGFWDRALRYVRINDFLAQINNLPIEEHLGRTPVEVLGPELGELVETDFRRVLATGEPMRNHELLSNAPSGPHERRIYLVSYDPVREATGDVIGISAVVQDVTEQRLALRRANFLAQAGEILDASLDYEETLQNVADLIVPDIADWCGMSMVAPDGTLKTVAVRHVDPAKVRLAWELNERYPTDPDSPTGTPNVIRTGASEYGNSITDEMLVRAARDEEHLRLIRALGMRAYIIAPLVAREKVVGVVTLLGAETKPKFTPEDVQLAEDLGRRAGLSIENARLYTERVRIAHTLQTRLLPDRLPEVPGVEVAARYSAAGELLEVGGDFYDVCPGTDGATVMFVGDVSGKGAEAAAATAMIRFTLRAAAHQEDSPAAMLRVLNDAMERGGQFCTVALVRLCRDTLTIALGGHPPAYLVRDGHARELGAFGTVIGSVDDARFTDVEVQLVAGDSVFIYTDGVIEGGSAQGALGEDGLARLLSESAGQNVDAIVDRVVDAAIAIQDGIARDDIAMLGFRVSG